MLKKISDFYQTAVVNDLQCVAYAYRPIAIEKEQIDPEVDSSIPGFITLPVRIFPEQEDKKLESLPSDSGGPSSRNADSEESDGTGFTASSSRRPSGTPNIDINTLPDPVNIVIDIGGPNDDDEEVHHYGSSVDDSAVAGAKIENGPLQRWRKLREMELPEAEEELMDPQAPVHSQEFCEEAVQGQIFLGMSTLAHRPKTVSPAKIYQDHAVSREHTNNHIDTGVLLLECVRLYRGSGTGRDSFCVLFTRE